MPKPTKEEAIQDIKTTQKEIEERKKKKANSPRKGQLNTGYDKMIEDRQEFIDFLKKEYNIEDDDLLYN